MKSLILIAALILSTLTFGGDDTPLQKTVMSSAFYKMSIAAVEVQYDMKCDEVADFDADHEGSFDLSVVCKDGEGEDHALYTVVIKGTKSKDVITNQGIIPGALYFESVSIEI